MEIFISDGLEEDNVHSVSTMKHLYTVTVKKFNW